MGPNGALGGGLRPSEVVFLDDIGVNLKPAKAMGMTTIKVFNDTEWQWLEAVAALERLTGVRLLEAKDRALHSWKHDAASCDGVNSRL